MTRYVAIDTETFRIGLDANGRITPKLVCVSFCEGEERDGELDFSPTLKSSVDKGLFEDLRQLFTPSNGIELVFHNAAFDIPVLCQEFPELETLIWEKLDRREVHDTMLREQLLNLSTHGKLEMLRLPDGSSQRISYTLDALVLKYLSVDISESKKGDDAWPANFDVLHGLPAHKYPAAAAEYAAMDASYTIQVFWHQSLAVESETGYASLSTETFQTAVSVALAWITSEGMATCQEKFDALRAGLDVELSAEKLEPLITAGILMPPMPPLPHKNKMAKAAELAGEWLGIEPEDVDWAKVDDGIRQALIDCGFKFKDAEPSSVKTAELKRRVLGVQIATWEQHSIEAVLENYQDLDTMVAVAVNAGVKYKRTATKDVCTNSEVISELADHDTVLACYQHRQKLQKLVSTEIPRMMWEGKLAKVVHFPYKTLLETGRTSSSATDKYPSANGQNVDPRARGVFRSRPGYKLCSTDYAALELVCVAQTTFDLFGFSVHRDKIIAGFDLHAYLGANLALMMSAEFLAWFPKVNPENAYRHFLSLKGHEDDNKSKFYEKWRKLAKPVGLGFPSGLGPYKMVGLAKKDPYNIDMVVLAEERFETHPHEFDLSKMRYYAKKLHRMKPEDMEWTPILKAIAFAMTLRSIWKATYPEMEAYFEWVEAQGDEHTPELSMAGEEGEEGEEAEDRKVPGLCYTTPMGMHRAACTYTAVSNGRCMQSPGAEGAKHAVFDLVRATRDPASKSLLRGTAIVVNFVHDELIVELLDDELLHERAMEVKGIMEDGLRKVIKDVPVKAEPCLMEYWDKYAKPVFDKAGRLVVWTPKPAVAA